MLKNVFNMRNVYILIGVICCVIVGVTYHMDTGATASANDGSIQQFKDKWVDSEGNYIDDKDNGITKVYNTIPATVSSGDYLCFRSKNTDIKVVVDSHEIYNYSTKVSDIFGDSSGSTWHYVPIDNLSVGKTIEIDIIPVYGGEHKMIDNIMFGSSGEYILRMLRTKIWHF